MAELSERDKRVILGDNFASILSSNDSEKRQADPRKWARERTTSRARQVASFHSRSHPAQPPHARRVFRAPALGVGCKHWVGPGHPAGALCPAGAGWPSRRPTSSPPPEKPPLLPALPNRRHGCAASNCARTRSHALQNLHRLRRPRRQARSSQGGHDR